MISLPLYLNELSLSIQDCTQAEKLEVVLGFIDTLRAAKGRRSNIKLFNSSHLYKCEIGDGDYLCTILKGRSYNDHWRFINSLVQKTPFDIDRSTFNVAYGTQQATGLALALESHSAAVSLLFEQAWNNKEISVSVGDNNELVPNLAIPDHVKDWDDLLRNYGIDVSASSVVFQEGPIKVRMFLNDHNPPHIHVEGVDCKAKINLRTFDIMDGRLPQHISGNIIDWAMQNQQDLLANWERCRTGSHPLLIGN